jgi:Tol biopolymer transport system component
MLREMSESGPGHWSLVALLSALALVTANGDSASARLEQTPSGSIVFVRGDHLYFTSADGGGVKRLTRDASDPAVSRDGRRIAFVREKSIWVMRRDGSGQTRLTSGHEDWTPAWSPDGSTIYFGRVGEGKDEHGSYALRMSLFRMQADGSGVRQLTRPQASDHGVCHENPSVSPDGRVIAYAYFGECDRGFDVGISAIDPAGRPVRLSTYDNVGTGFDPAWAPVGKWIAFAPTGDYEQSIGISIASPGSQARRVYKRAASDPAWSPDGLWLAFVRGVGRGTIWLVRSDGTGLRRLSSRRYDADPAWLPATR